MKSNYVLKKCKWSLLFLALFSIQVVFGQNKDLYTVNTADIVSSGITIEQALRKGCFLSSELENMVNKVMAELKTDSRTYRQLKKYYSVMARDRTTTKIKVTNKYTWVFRASSQVWHVKKLEDGILYSKAQNRVDDLIKNNKSTIEFWDSNGPELKAVDDSERNADFLVLRILATQSSDEPTSQFVSVALNYNTARSFGDTVYAFQVSPGSNILGLVDGRVGKGEDQFQILGGTPITQLHRKIKNQSWEQYDTKTRSWKLVSKVPFNY